MSRTVVESSRQVGALVTSCGVLMLAAGCATPARVASPEILWPAPPLTPHIKFLTAFSSQEDFQRAAGQPERSGVLDMLLGRNPAPNALTQPMDLAVSGNGQQLYVTDFAKPGVFRFDFETRRMEPFAEAAGFEAPFGIALDGHDNIYVADSARRCIEVLAPDGTPMRSLAPEGLERPTDIAIDAARGRLYVADAASLRAPHRQVHMLDLDGQPLGMLADADGSPHDFASPTYVAVGADGSVYVSDTLKAQVQVFTPDGRYDRSVGERGDAYGMFDKPKGVALDTFGNLYVVDSAWSNVQIFNRQDAVLLFFGGRGAAPGLLFNPTGIAIDTDNRIFVADAFNGRISIYQLINTTAEDSLPTAD